VTRRLGDVLFLRFSRYHVLTFILIFCLLIISCGRKGDPTLKSYEKPNAPSGLRAIHRESDILLFWDFPKDKEQMIKGFYLLKAKGDKLDFEKVAFLEPVNRSYVDKDFKVGSQYKYKIISANLRGILSNDSNIIEIVLREPPPPPEKLSFKIEFNSLTLTWQNTGDEVLNNIYKTDKKGVYSLTPINKEPIKGTSFKDTFNVSKQIYYTMRSLKGGVIRDEGSVSKELEIDPSDFAPSALEGLQAVVTSEQVYLIWKEAPETWVVGYRVYREVDDKEGYLFIGETTIPAFIDKERPLTKRNYRVTALGPLKEGPPAEIKDIVFVPYR
jgi:fibronectin type 3 domain-containing protein